MVNRMCLHFSKSAFRCCLVIPPACFDEIILADNTQCTPLLKVAEEGMRQSHLKRGINMI